MIAVSVSPQQAAQIREAVERGGYASSSQVVREALHLWFDARWGDGSVISPSEQARKLSDADQTFAERVRVAELFSAHRNRSRA